MTANPGVTIDQLGPGAALSGTERIPMFQGSNPALATTPAAINAYVAANFLSTNFVTPQQFGAVGDGITDDTTALQSAMASDLPMYLPPDSAFLFFSDLIYSGTRTKEVYSSGRASATLIMGNATQNGLVRTNGNFNIHDLGITTNILKTAGSAILMGGTTNNVNGDKIENNQIFGTLSTPLYIGINNNTDVIPAIIDNYILSCSFAGIVLNNVTGGGTGGGESLIAFNTLNTVLAHGNGAVGILFQSGQNSIRIEENIVQDYDTGLALNVANGVSVNVVTVIGGSFENNLVGIEATPTGTASIDALEIIDAYFFPTSAGYAILVAGASNWINRINMVGLSGVYQTGGAIHIAAGVLFSITDSMLEATGNIAAILLDASYPSVMGSIKNNIFYGSNVPISNNGTVTVIEGNLGYNPVGSTSVSPGASPFTYKASSSHETLYMAASGGISSITRGGQGVIPASIANNTTLPVQIDALDSIVITYGGTLTLLKTIH